MTGRTQLSVDLIAKVGGFIANMGKAARSADGLTSKLRDVSRVGLAGIGAGAAAGGAALAAGLTVAINRADQLGEASERLGLTTEQFTALGFAAQFSGIESSKFEAAIRGFNSRIEKTEPLLQSLGVETRNLATGAFLPSTEIIKGLADVFKDLPPGIEESQLAADLFGTRLGGQMIPLLNRGTEGIVEMEDKARRLGGVLSTEAAQAAGQFKDRLDEVQIVLNGALVKLIPQATVALDSFADVITDPNFVEGLGSIITLLGQTAAGFGLIISQASAAASSMRSFSDDQSDQQLETRLAALNTSINAARRANGGQLPENFEITMPNVARDMAERTRIIREQRRRILAGRGAFDFITPDNLGTADKPPSATGPTADPLAALKAAQDEAERKRKAEAAQRDAAAAAAKHQADAERELGRAVEEEAKRMEGARRAQLEVEFDLMEAVRMEDEQRERSLAAGRDLVENLEFELALMRMTNEERATAIQLRGLDSEAIRKYGDDIAALNQKIADSQREIQFSDDIRRGFEDTFASIIDGSKGAKDALSDLASYITSLVAQRLSEQLVDSLFGKPGTPLGGGGGGGGGIGSFISTAISSFFGGGRAAGGFVAPGKMYEVAERGPELLTVGRRQFLLPTATGGMVTPNSRIGGGGGVVQNINVQGRIDTRTAAQLARETQRAQSRAAARFGA
jgi:hypothetical protein